MIEGNARYLDWALNMADKEKARTIELSILASLNFLLWITGVYLQLPNWILFMDMMAGIFTGICAVTSWRSWEMWKTEIRIWLNSIVAPPREEI